MDADIKVFTLEEAEQLLELLAPMVQDLQIISRDLRKIQDDIEDVSAKLAQGNGYPIHRIRQELDQLEARHRELGERFESAIERLRALGCLLKDVDLGLLDFYSLRDGELVFLCWKLGEDRIRFWHGVEDGFAGRQPLP